MAGEYVIVNPRRRRRRRRTRRARAARPRRRRRRNPFIMNPRRRRRRRAYRARRRARRNPRIGLGTVTRYLPEIGWGGAGIVATGIAVDQVMKAFPQIPQAGGWTRLGAKAAIALAAPMILKPMIGGRGANAFMIGALAGLGADLVRTFLLPAMGMSDYEYGTLSLYQSGELGDGGGGALSSVLGESGSVYTGGAYS